MPETITLIKTTIRYLVMRMAENKNAKHFHELATGVWDAAGHSLLDLKSQGHSAA